mmetsp:Transcript_35984/g.66128  ORF Transcript_35984/g.66128 Transcript_35984/m.66128 type:complete len:244 (-) Transcript_35984:88-819(-)
MDNARQSIWIILSSTMDLHGREQCLHICCKLVPISKLCLHLSLPRLVHNWLLQGVIPRRCVGSFGCLVYLRAYPTDHEVCWRQVILTATFKHVQLVASTIVRQVAQLLAVLYSKSAVQVPEATQPFHGLLALANKRTIHVGNQGPRFHVQVHNCNLSTSDNCDGRLRRRERSYLVVASAWGIVPTRLVRCPWHTLQAPTEHWDCYSPPAAVFRGGHEGDVCPLLSLKTIMKDWCLPASFVIDG